jgi:diketogulonate reductase-like aldo/keto reductase
MNITNIKLDSGQAIPQLGLGLWMNKNKDECQRTVEQALELGYRHFDTAQIYGNEEFVGNVLARTKVLRKDLFITTKIWNDNFWWDDLIPSFEESLTKLRTGYVDLLLLHFPVTETRGPAWRKMEEIFKSGKARSIGVSNYTIKHLEELLKQAEVKPDVNQVELHVYLQQPELVAYCKKHDIVLEAYSPLAHGYGIDNPVLAGIGKKHGKSPAQIMIRWCIESGFVVLPKTTHKARLKENMEVFDFKLDSNDMKQLSKLEKNYRTCWDPTNVQ